MKTSALRFASALALSSAVLTHAATYRLSEDIVGNGFYNSFDWQAIPDPTHGRVNYVDQGTSRAQNLSFASGDTFILRSDYRTRLSPWGPGRSSNRIRSKRTYRNHVAVFNIRHMPQGCGTWPAVWEVKEAGWPNGGEVDIVEGVNDVAPNAATLHTTAGCTMPGNAGHQGQFHQTDCNWLVNGNTGCNVKFPSANSFGPAFNNNGGGWFAIERTDSYMKVWFWPRNGSPPSEVRNGGGQANPDNWGLPMAYFPDTFCRIPTYFQEHHIIINLTFCGDWAGTTYNSDGCPGSCVDNVDNNPGAFQNAYFDFGFLRVYQ